MPRPRAFLFLLDPAARTIDKGSSMAWLLPLSWYRASHGSYSMGMFSGCGGMPLDLDRLIGWELNTLPVRTGTGQQLRLYYSAFRSGRAAEFTGLGREREWSQRAYLQAPFSFGGGSPPIC